MSKSIAALESYLEAMTPYETPMRIAGVVIAENSALKWVYPGGLTIILEFFDFDDVFCEIKSPELTIEEFGDFAEVSEMTGDALFRHIGNLEGDDLQAWEAIERRRTHGKPN